MYVSGGAEGSVGRDVRVMWTEGTERCVSGSVWGVCGDDAGRCVFRQTQIWDCRALRASSGAERFVCKTVQSDVLSLGNEAICV